MTGTVRPKQHGLASGNALLHGYSFALHGQRSFGREVGGGPLWTPGSISVTARPDTNAVSQALSYSFCRMEP